MARRRGYALRQESVGRAEIYERLASREREIEDVVGRIRALATEHERTGIKLSGSEKDRFNLAWRGTLSLHFDAFLGRVGQLLAAGAGVAAGMTGAAKLSNPLTAGLSPVWFGLATSMLALSHIYGDGVESIKAELDKRRR